MATAMQALGYAVAYYGSVEEFLSLQSLAAGPPRSDGTPHVHVCMVVKRIDPRFCLLCRRLGGVCLLDILDLHAYPTMTDAKARRLGRSLFDMVGWRENVPIYVESIPSGIRGNDTVIFVSSKLPPSPRWTEWSPAVRCMRS